MLLVKVAYAPGPDSSVQLQGASLAALAEPWHLGVLNSTAYTKGPSGDTTRNWIVKTLDGKILTTGALFPSPKQEIEITCKGDQPVVSEPERRVRGKTPLKELLPVSQESPRLNPTCVWEQLAKHGLENKDFGCEAISKVLSPAVHQVKSMRLQEGMAN